MKWTRSDKGIAQIIGVEKALALGGALGGMSFRAPLANKFIARVLRSQGLSTNEIARKIRTTSVTVPSLLEEDGPLRDDKRADDCARMADSFAAAANRLRRRAKLKSTLARAPQAIGKAPK